jgi:nickel/cobalt transporter (NiCoT) family protein
VAIFIGTIELVGLLAHDSHLTGRFWTFIEGFNINTAGFVIVGMFIVTWVAAVLIWRYGHIEEKWTARLQQGAGVKETPLSPTLAETSE